MDPVVENGIKTFQKYRNMKNHGLLTNLGNKMVLLRGSDAIFH